MATPAKSQKPERTHVAIDKATLHDISGIQSVLLANKQDASLLQRSRANIQRNLRDFVVATDENGRLMGCAAVHFHAHRSAEILSLAVMPAAQGKGIGPRLMDECEAIAEERGAEMVWLATTKPEYFARLGYRRFSRWSLSRPVLMTKLRQVLEQPAGRWIPSLLGRFKFMRKQLRMQFSGAKARCIFSVLRHD